MNKKTKIIEIYVLENKKEDTFQFDFKRKKDTQAANMMMKALASMIANFKRDEDELEVEYE